MASLAARLELVPDARAADEARRAVRAVLGEWSLPAGLMQDVVLMVSELVTNAIVHARTASTLELELGVGPSGTCLRITLADGSPEAPLKRHPARTDEGGRGLTIVGALSSRWGIEPYVGGKRVWVEVDLARSSAATRSSRARRALARDSA